MRLNLGEKEQRKRRLKLFSLPNNYNSLNLKIVGRVAIFLRLGEIERRIDLLFILVFSTGIPFFINLPM